MTEKQKKSLAQRAQEALDVAERRVEKLEKKQARLHGELKTLDREVVDAKQRRDYLAQNPDLPDHPEPEAAPRKSDDPVPEF